MVIIQSESQQIFDKQTEVIRNSGVYIKKRKVMRQFCLSEAGTISLLKT